jgi:hypothetical protein
MEHREDDLAGQIFLEKAQGDPGSGDLPLGSAFR